VPYGLTGPFDPGNVFIAQLSDANGSFASPTTIGTVISNMDGTIACTIPANTPPGNGYRIRVNSTSPAVTGEDNSIDIAITAAPDAGEDAVLQICSNDDPFQLFPLLGGTPQAGGSWTSPPNLPHSGVYDPATDAPGCYTYTVDAVGCASATAQVCVGVITAPDAGLDSSIVLCENGAPYDLFEALGGTPTIGGSWLAGGGPFSGIYEPGVTQGEVFIYVVDGQEPCTSSSASVTVTLDPCLGIGENDGSASAIAWLGQAGNEQRFAIAVPASAVHVFDARGAQLYTSPVIAAQGGILMEAGALPSGLYTAVFTCVDGLPRTVRFVHAARW
jgi:hypothetical protein